MADSGSGPKHDHKHPHDRDHDHDGGLDHDHEHEHPHDHAGHGGLGLGHFHAHGGSGAPSAIVKAIAITLVFMGIELIGGWLSNSLALVSDAAHMLTDVGAMLLSLFAIWVSRRPANSRMSFGYHRAEILGALASGLSIWLIAGVLIYEAVLRIQSPPEVKGPVVFLVASVGLAANLVNMRILHSSQHENMNVRAAYLHMLADSLGSVGAVIAGLTLWVTDWRPIDPIVTFVFSALMLASSWSLIKDAAFVLMESAPSHVDPAAVRAALAALPGVAEVHDLHIWSVSSGKLALSVHLISEESSGLLSRANGLLKERYQILHTTIQVEHPDRFRSEQCYDCAPSDPKT